MDTLVRTIDSPSSEWISEYFSMAFFRAMSLYLLFCSAKHLEMIATRPKYSSNLFERTIL